eukprot:m.885812 g.885812  ORF g.885812 m.885812 type:complete len:100 (-) comp23622_c0_seq23:1650-1949(-)
MPTTGTNTVARTGLLWHLVSDGQCANCYYADVVEKINGRLGTASPGGKDVSESGCQMHRCLQQHRSGNKDVSVLHLQRVSLVTNVWALLRSGLQVRCTR